VYGPNQKVTDEFNKIKLSYAEHMFQQGKDKYDEGIQTKDDFKLLYAKAISPMPSNTIPIWPQPKSWPARYGAKTINMPDPESNIPAGGD